MKLDSLLKKIEYTLLCGNLDHDVSDLCYDSRKADSGKLFVAMVGTNVDGHDYVNSAYDNGCRVFVVERPVSLPCDPKTTIIQVKNCRVALALLSKNFFDDPSSKMVMIGITGTKGKSSITCILKTVLDAAGHNTGTIGTTGIFYNDKEFASLNTTPESYETYRYLYEMQKAGCTQRYRQVDPSDPESVRGF